MSIFFEIVIEQDEKNKLDFVNVFIVINEIDKIIISIVFVRQISLFSYYIILMLNEKQNE